MNLNLVTIGLSSHLDEDKVYHSKINLIPFENYDQFLSCRLSIRSLNGFLCHSDCDLTIVSELRRAYPTSAILVVCKSFDNDKAIRALSAGASDIIFSDVASPDTFHRIAARLVQMKTEADVKQAQSKHAEEKLQEQQQPIAPASSL
ncbi:MAG: hypothetical protein HRU09_19960 [Oligoflexales bacterium]|nr:hypothetical protein [Oligoflexales bacterium]